MQRATLFFISVFVFVIQYTMVCAQDTTSRLGYVKHSRPPYTDIWTYNKDGRPERVNSILADSTVFTSHVFMRDANGRLVRSETRDTNNLPLVVFSYIYNEEGQVQQIDKLVDADFNRVADNVEHIFYFTYDTAGRVETIRMIKGTRMERHYVYTWTGNNITGITNIEGELHYSMKLEYDHQPNYIKAIAWEYMITTGTLDFYALMFSSNNLVNAEFIPEGMPKENMDIQPRYYENGTYKANTFEGVEYGYSPVFPNR